MTTEENEIPPPLRDMLTCSTTEMWYYTTPISPRTTTRSTSGATSHYILSEKSEQSCFQVQLWTCQLWGMADTFITTLFLKILCKLP